ncbi:hypothetical protein OH491_23925 [Termitidicoccus mucosus]
MNRKIYIWFFLTASPMLWLAGQPREVPATLPAPMRPVKSTETPVDLRPVDYFGKVKAPLLEAYDPMRSAFFQEGRDASAERLPEGRVLRDLSRRQILRYGSLPTVAITEGRAVSVLLMRNGYIVKPAAAGLVPPPESMVQVITMPDSPYLYFQANAQAVFPENFRYTHVFIPLELEGRPVQFQIRLKIVRPSSEEILPLVILDMVGGFPDVMAPQAAVPSALSGSGGAGPDGVFPTNSSGPFVANRVPDGASVPGYAGAGGMNSYVFGSRGPTPLYAPFQRGEVREYFPTMIEMIHLYEQAVFDRADGYSSENLVRFRPKSVMDGRVVDGPVSGFVNPEDRQTYWLLWGYWFPEYDAVVYELSVRNLSPGTLWWDFGLLKVLWGFDTPETPAPGGPRSVVVSLEGAEETDAGRFNTLWILSQGAGIHPVNTPVRFMFPSPASIRTRGRGDAVTWRAAGVVIQDGR